MKTSIVPACSVQVGVITNPDTESDRLIVVGGSDVSGYTWRLNQKALSALPSSLCRMLPAIMCFTAMTAAARSPARRTRNLGVPLATLLSSTRPSSAFLWSRCIAYTCLGVEGKVALVFRPLRRSWAEAPPPLSQLASTHQPTEVSSGVALGAPTPPTASATVSTRASQRVFLPTSAARPTLSGAAMRPILSGNTASSFPITPCFLEASCMVFGLRGALAIILLVDLDNDGCPAGLVADWDSLWLFMPPDEGGLVWRMNGSQLATGWELTAATWGGFGRKVCGWLSAGSILSHRFLGSRNSSARRTGVY